MMLNISPNEESLKVFVKNGKLTMTIGVKSLATFINGDEETCLGFKVIDSAVFAEELVKELSSPLDEEIDEDHTPIHELLTGAAMTVFYHNEGKGCLECDGTGHYKDKFK